MIPKHVTSERFFELLHIKKKNIGGCLENGWVRLEFLYERYGQERGFELFKSELNNGGCYQTWKKHSSEAFIVAFWESWYLQREEEKSAPIWLRLLPFLRRILRSPSCP